MPPKRAGSAAPSVWRSQVFEATLPVTQSVVVDVPASEIDKKFDDFRKESEEARKSIELTDFAINLEHAGDIVAKNLLVLADERSQRNLQFSRAGWTELKELHERLVENMHLALNVLISSDLSSARQLVVEKERMRVLERQSHDGHLMRLRSGTPESVETSDMHLEITRAFKEINSLLVTVAYPLLTESGDLLESRLAKTN